MNNRRLEDAFAPMPDVVREHIDEALTEVNVMNSEHSKPMMAVALVVFLVLALAGTAVAAGIRWGALDFISAREFGGDALPEARDALRTAISQEGGVTDWAVFTIREALCDGHYAWLVIDVAPTDEDTLLVAGGLSPHVPASRYSPELPEDMTLAQWVEASSYTRIMAVSIEQENLPGNLVDLAQISWHNEENGAVSIMVRVLYGAEESGAQSFICSVMPWWTKEEQRRAPQKVTLTAHLERGDEPLWTASWTGEVRIPNSNIVVEEIKLTGTVVSMYSEITCSATEAVYPQYPWIYPVDEQGRRMEWSAGNTVLRSDGNTQVVNWTEKLEEGRYRCYESFAPLEEPPESLWISGQFDGKRLEEVEIPLK